jgi:hypothetical protein
MLSTSPAAAMVAMDVMGTQALQETTRVATAEAQRKVCQLNSKAAIQFLSIHAQACC